MYNGINRGEEVREKMPESQNMEWKLRWKDEYLEWICGYANAQGGKIYIGCDDEGRVTGLPNAKKLLEDIPNKIRDAMGIIVGVNLLTEGGRERHLLLPERQHKAGAYGPCIGGLSYAQTGGHLG